MSDVNRFDRALINRLILANENNVVNQLLDQADRHPASSVSVMATPAQVVSNIRLTIVTIFPNDINDIVIFADPVAHYQLMSKLPYPLLASNSLRIRNKVIIAKRVKTKHLGVSEVYLKLTTYDFTEAHAHLNRTMVDAGLKPSHFKPSSKGYVLADSPKTDVPVFEVLEQHPIIDNQYKLVVNDLKSVGFENTIQLHRSLKKLNQSINIHLGVPKHLRSAKSHTRQEWMEIVAAGNNPISIVDVLKHTDGEDGQLKFDLIVNIPNIELANRLGELIVEGLLFIVPRTLDYPDPVIASLHFNTPYHAFDRMDKIREEFQ